MAGFHCVISFYLFCCILGTAFHLKGLSVCGHYSESTLLVFLLTNIWYALIYFSNLKFTGEFDSYIVKRAKLMFFILMIVSPFFLITPFLPGLFCKFNDFESQAIHKGIMFMMVVLLESIAGTCYFIRYEKFKLHRELYAKPIDTSLTL